MMVMSSASMVGAGSLGSATGVSGAADRISVAMEAAEWVGFGGATGPSPLVT
jgi:hypothetical protein